MPLKKTSFTLRLTLAVIQCIVLVFVATFFVVGYIVNSQIRSEAGHRSYSALETATLYINSNLKEVENAVESNVWIIEQYRNDTNALKLITKKLLYDNPAVVGCIIALNPDEYNGLKFAGYSTRGSDNVQINTSNIYNKNYDYLYMDWYQIPILLGTPSWSEPYYDEGGANKKVTTYSYPLKDSTGAVYAIFTADLSLQWLTAKATSIKPYDNSSTMVVSRNGSFVVNAFDESSTNETIFTYAFEYTNDSTLLKAGKKMLSGISYQFFTNIFGEDYYCVYGPLDNGWSIIMMSTIKDVLQTNIVVNLALILIGVISIIFIALTMIHLIKNMTKPIRGFSSILLKIADNKFDNKLPVVHTDDELKILHDSVDALQKSLKENLEHKKDILSARSIQRSIVPVPLFKNDKLSLAAMIDPAKEVGGDLYDYHFSSKKNKIFFLVGDVSGKGVPAALFMAMTVSAFRIISRLGMDENQIVKHINNTVSQDNQTDMFVTMFFASFDYESYKIKFCNAGHNPPIIIWPDGNAEYLKVKPNIVLGAIDDFDYQDQEIQLETGCRILVYSDGVTEAERSDKSQFGEERLLQWAKNLPKEYTSEQAVKSLRKNVKTFTESLQQNIPQNDDITIMIITI